MQVPDQEFRASPTAVGGEAAAPVGIGKTGFWLTLKLTQEIAFVNCPISIGQDADRSLAAFKALRTQKAGSGTLHPQTPTYATIHPRPSLFSRPPGPVTGFFNGLLPTLLMCLSDDFREYSFT